MIFILIVPFWLSPTVVVLPLVTLHSCLPWLVVASPLVAPPPPLNAPAAASRHIVASPPPVAATSRLRFVKNNPPTPGKLFFWTLAANG
jgi:hypothetical protein